MMKYLIYKNSNIIPPIQYKIVGEEKDYYVIEGKEKLYIKVKKDMCIVFNDKADCDGIDCAWCIESDCPKMQKRKEG